MSAGAFESSKYEADDGTIYKIRVQPETEAAEFGDPAVANAAPSGAVTGKVSARVGGGNRQYGVKARAVTVKWTSTVPSGYKSDEVLRIPILQKSLYDSVASGATGTYLGQPVEVVGKLPERIR